MYKYINNYVEYVEKYPITDYGDWKSITEDQLNAFLLKYKPLPFMPAALKEAMLLIGTKYFEMGFINLNETNNRMWKMYIEETLKKEASFFVIEEYLTSFAAFVYLDGNDNPPVYAYFDDYEDKSCESFLWQPNIETFLIHQYKRDYKEFEERLAGRVELRERVEHTKVILKPLYETANTLITPYATEADDRQNFRLALWGLKWSYKTLFYEPYLLRYHSDFSKWEAEMLKFNKSVIDDIKLILPVFEKENPPLALRVAELGRQFVNFEQTIRWVAAAPDATVRKPSPAAQDAAKEERDITDFLL